MRSNIFYTVCLAATIFLLSSCNRKNIQNSYSSESAKRSSLEIENSTINNQETNFVSEKASIKQTPFENKSVEKLKKRKAIFPQQEKVHEIYQEKNIPAKDIKSKFEKKKTSIDRDNIFFKIGMGFIRVGLFVLSIFGGVSISVVHSNANGGIFFFTTAIIGLGIIVLGLLFLLLAVITEAMKRRASYRTPVQPGGDEI